MKRSMTARRRREGWRAAQAGTACASVASGAPERIGGGEGGEREHNERATDDE